MGTYSEAAPRTALRAVASCTWQRSAPGGEHVVVVPDASVDLVWLDGRELVVAGADTGPHPMTTAPGTRTTGVRLGAAAAGGFLGLPASEVADRVVPAAELWPDATDLADRLAGDPDAATDLLQDFVAAHADAPDPLVAAAASRLAEPGARTASVAADLGVSSRQLHRRTTAAIGYGPKVLARVLRLRRFQTITGGPLADRAVASGYAHQAHLSDEVRALTGMTPVRFLEYLGRPAA